MHFYFLASKEYSSLLLIVAEPLKKAIGQGAISSGWKGLNLQAQINRIPLNRKGHPVNLLITPAGLITCRSVQCSPPGSNVSYRTLLGGLRSFVRTRGGICSSPEVGLKMRLGVNYRRDN